MFVEFHYITLHYFHKKLYTWECIMYESMPVLYYYMYESMPALFYYIYLDMCTNEDVYTL